MSLIAGPSYRLTRIAILAVLAAGCDTADELQLQRPSLEMARAEFVGGTVCVTCHAVEAALWSGSQHDQALQLADPETVLGDFNDAEYTNGEATTSFYSRGNERWVRTDGPDGTLENFRITHTIGIDPLQQYLVELPDGHFQALSIAWDTRAAEAGGQRWFNLYAGEQIDSRDPLHWTGTYQNWNTMCAECHSTDLIKNYDFSSNSFDTIFSSIDVSCEACHGPGSNHAEDPSVATPALMSAQRSWIFRDGASIATLANGSDGSSEIEVCAQCHARRSQLTDGHEPQDSFLNGFRPALLDAGLYHADGQILDEVYVYGSFMQSAMAAAGVICSDCHEPHSAELRADGNAVCARCHLPGAFDTPAHHHHENDSAGSECVSCHMRAETYMVVDPRRDHSFRLPRPRLSARIGSPNACSDCHSDQTAEWAANQIATWYPNGRQGEFHYGEALHAGRLWGEDRAPLLRRVIEDRDQPAIARATAVSLLAEQPASADVELIGRAVDDPNPLVQLAALEALRNFPPMLHFERAQRLLTDPLLALRVTAARSLLAARSELSESRQRDLDAALAEYVEVEDFNSDRGEGLFNAANLAVELDRPEDAERLFLAAIEREPGFSGSYVNLGDLYRNLGRETETENILRQGLTINPDDAGLRFGLGLSLVRLSRPDDALESLSAAVTNAPDSPRYAYVHGIALNSVGQTAQAIDALRSAHQRFPAHRDTLFGLATILRDSGDIDAALEYATKLVTLVPSDPGARGLLEELEAASGR